MLVHSIPHARALHTPCPCTPYPMPVHSIPHAQYLQRTLALAELHVDPVDDVAELRDEGGRLDQ